MQASQGDPCLRYRRISAPYSSWGSVLTTVAVDGLVGTMFRWRELRTHKPAIRALTDRIEREMPGLRKALSYAIALRRGA